MSTKLFALLGILLLSACDGAEDSGTFRDTVSTGLPMQGDTVINLGVDSARRDNTRVNNNSQTDANQVRLVVSFISRGTGIDSQLKKDFELWLAKKPDVKYEVQSWGREGEVNYCFALNGWETDDQDSFVKDVKSYLAGRQMVVINENARCDNWKSE